MKIKYEAEIQDCSQCELFMRRPEKKVWRCVHDFADAELLIENDGFYVKIVKLPCEVRPCPLEVKDEPK